MGKRVLISIIAVLILSLISVIPVSGADEKEMPSVLDAAIVGLAEYSPGDDGVIQIAIQNNNKLKDIKQAAIKAGVSSYYGAAVSLTATLDKQSAPIEIKTETALVGTLTSGMATPPVPFHIKAQNSAAAGDYEVKLTLQYRTLKLADEDEDAEKYLTEWTERTDTRILKITIKAKEKVTEQLLDFSIARVDGEKFAPGDTGSVQVRVQNNKTVDKIDSSAYQANLSQSYGAASGLLARVDKRNAPVTVKTNDVLLGTLPAGQATPALPIFLEVNEDALPGTYTINVAISYKTLKSTSIKEGDPELEWSSGSASQDINIEIKEKPLKFEVMEVKSDLTPGEKKEIQVTFRNTGNKKAQDATVKVSASSPLSMTDNSAFLGTLQPGGNSAGTFVLKVMGDAIQKEYTLDASVQYLDTLGEKVSSDIIKVPVMVNPAQTQRTLLNDLQDQWKMAAGGAGLIVVAWVVVGIVQSRRKKSR
jgi:hypothetical protein